MIMQIMMMVMNMEKNDFFSLLVQFEMILCVQLHAINLKMAAKWIFSWVWKFKQMWKSASSKWSVTGLSYQYDNTNSGWTRLD